VLIVFGVYFCLVGSQFVCWCVVLAVPVLWFDIFAELLSCMSGVVAMESTLVIWCLHWFTCFLCVCLLSVCRLDCGLLCLGLCLMYCWI